MKRVLILLIAVTSLIFGCDRKQDERNESTEAVLPIPVTESPNEAVTIESNVSQSHLRYSGIDFSKLPVNSAMLDLWNIDTEKEGDFQYRNSSLTMEELNLASQNFIRDNGLTDDEKKAVGFWFAMDGITQSDEGISFMNALRKSKYPRLALYPNGYFVCSWSDNSPVNNGVNSNEIGDLRNLFFRGKWSVHNTKIVLHYYQYLVDIVGSDWLYINLEKPYELELVDLDALTPDHFSTQPFSAFTQPSEILDKIPKDLVFINQPAYFVKSYYSWEPEMNSPPPLLWSQLFSTADSIMRRTKSEGLTLDDILTSTAGLLLERYWD